jgi:hypothetical protein
MTERYLHQLSNWLGLIWPFEVAPYKVMFLPLSTTPNSMEILEDAMNVVDLEVSKCTVFSPSLHWIVQ